MSRYSVRLEFLGNNRIFIGGGKNFSDPTTFQCNKEKLPQDVLEKIAILDVQGSRNEIPRVGKRLREALYYIHMTPEAFDAFKEKVGV